MKKFLIALFAVVLAVSTCQKTYAHDGDVIMALEYYRFPDGLKADDETKYRLSFNFGLGGNLLFTDMIGIRAQTNFHIPLLSLLEDALSSSDETNTELGFAWSVGIGPVFKIPVSNDGTFEISIQIQNFLATNYWPEGKYRGGSDSLALGGEFLYRCSMGEKTGGIAIGFAYYKIFNEYFFKCSERYRGFNKGFIIRPMFIYSLGF